MSPALLVLGLFGIFPIGYALFVSLHRWRIKREAFVGWRHYERALGEPQWILCAVAGLVVLWLVLGLWTRGSPDRNRPASAVRGLVLLAGGLSLLVGLVGLCSNGDIRLINAVKVTIFYALGTIPFEVGGALLLAYLLFRTLMARGFMRDGPLLLVLDEPTAALDAETEHALFERYANAARGNGDEPANGRITLLVSHRFSTVRMANLIVVLDGARVVEVGSHEELMLAAGHYAELYEIQAAAYR